MSLLAGPAIHAEPVSNGAAQIASDLIAATVIKAAQRFGISTLWIRDVMQAESGGDARAVSSKGAMGLMQIMPETWADLRQRYGLGADPFDPHDNIIAGTRTISQQATRCRPKRAPMSQCSRR
jgi:soluble lytic murein transglycosylase-like protein